MSDKSIDVLMDELPQDDLTVKMLKLLDYVIPGEWENVVGFDNLITKVTGQSDPEIIQKVRTRALELFANEDEGYKTSMWLYDKIDLTDKAVGAAALASKAGEQISFLKFLDKITPKADTTQTIDFVLKLVVEVVAYTKLNGIPGTEINEFVKSLQDHYKEEALMRIVALIAVDGLIPLGPDFLKIIGDKLDGFDAPDLSNNALFKSISQFIPGADAGGKLAFITGTFQTAKTWIEGFVQSKGISFDSIKENLGTIIEFADGKLDYVAATLDMTTNYYKHTGTQTVAKKLIERAYQEI